MSAPENVEGFATIPRWLLYDQGVSFDAKGVYLVLSSHVGANGFAWPSHQRIADLMGRSKPTVKRALRELRDAGLVTWEIRFKADGQPDSNAYRLTVDRPSGGGVTQTPHGVTEGGVGSDRPQGGVTQTRGWGLCEPLTRVNERESMNEVNTSSSEASPSDANKGREDALRLCEHLARRMVEDGCTPPAITDKWLAAARLLMDKDGRTEEQIHRAIDWCQDSDFWRSNIHSMPKLRERYDTLRQQAERESKGPKSPVTYQPYRDADEWGDQLAAWHAENQETSA